MYSRPVIARTPLADRSLPTRKVAEKKEPMSAWQRWEMSSFADESLSANDEASTASEPMMEPFEPVLLIDEAELARLRLQAQQAGEAAGHALGYARGQAEGHAAALSAVHAQAAQLEALTQAWPNALRLAERQVADDLLALALDIAHQVLRQALTIDPQAILTVVHELLQAEPALSGTPQLLLHPDDAVLVNEHLSDALQDAGWRIRADAQIQRGGCRVLANSGERDATLETRWERVAATLARTPPVGASHD
ncbi:flagellar assembly protein FliH [Polaromonas sp. OV174]|uniref:flagellar assembly protein FliH n=1 Tax=Polaromonas sp. OV174 TaxID=1855300 RepID=UPI0008E94FE0|nr:flagellar assembly protein FliH [Polaromonas sp. OV174]SFC75579.1 flagellar assembly protein FliH [Polaromonas sp. OV174]